MIISKDKTVPLQAWSGPEGSRKLRFPDFMTTAQDCGKVVSLMHRPPLPQEMLLVLIYVRVWVDPRAIVRSEGFYINEKFQWHHLGSNQRPTDLQHTTLTTVLPRSTHDYITDDKLKGTKAVGTAVAQWLRCCATNQKVAGSIPAGVNGFFVDIKSFRSHYGPGVDSAFNRNEYQKYFLGVKAAGA